MEYEMDFYEYYKNCVIDWFDNLTNKQQMDIIAGFDHVLEDEESPSDFIEWSDGDFLYQNLEAAIERCSTTELEWNQYDVVKSIVTAAAKDDVYCDFAEDFIEDIAERFGDYKDPKGVFEDLSHGCKSGIVGMFIYHSDCKKYYIDHIDSMEDYKQELDEEIGEVIRNTEDLPHYTFICWLCYEEFSYRIARNLFPNNF